MSGSWLWLAGNPPMCRRQAHASETVPYSASLRGVFSGYLRLQGQRWQFAQIGCAPPLSASTDKGCSLSGVCGGCPASTAGMWWLWRTLSCRSLSCCRVLSRELLATTPMRAAAPALWRTVARRRVFSVEREKCLYLIATRNCCSNWGFFVTLFIIAVQSYFILL